MGRRRAMCMFAAGAGETAGSGRACLPWRLPASAAQHCPLLAALRQQWQAASPHRTNPPPPRPAWPPASCSPHTPRHYVWPLAHMVAALTTRDAARQASLLRDLLGMQCGNGLMHESVDVRNRRRCTRALFEWWVAAHLLGQCAAAVGAAAAPRSEACAPLVGRAPGHCRACTAAGPMRCWWWGRSSCWVRTARCPPRRSCSETGWVPGCGGRQGKGWTPVQQRSVACPARKACGTRESRRLPPPPWSALPAGTQVRREYSWLRGGSRVEHPLVYAGLDVGVHHGP